MSNDLNLPIHPSRRHPLTGEPLRAIWVRPDGRVMWPIIGAAPDDPPPADNPPADNPPADPPPADKPPADPPGDLGFPKDTPVAQMKPEQQAAYWQHQSRKHEERATEYRSAAGGKTAAEVKADLENAAKLAREKLTDQERAVEEAKDAGRAEARAEAGPKAVKAALSLLLGDMPEAEQNAQIELLDLSKFLTETGEVDTAKVRLIAEKIAPAGKGGDRVRNWPAGDRRTDKSSGVEGGRDLFKDRHGKKTSTSTSS